MRTLRATRQQLRVSLHNVMRTPFSVERSFHLFDTDGDGVLSAHDVVARSKGEPNFDVVRKLIARGDTDGDGALTEAEFAKLVDLYQQKEGSITISENGEVTFY